jgi:urease subunit alpha
MFGALGSAVTSTSTTFVSKAAIEENVAQRLGLKRNITACQNVRQVTKNNMIHNDLMPEVEVDPQTYEVKADGVLLHCEPAESLPMSQRYFLF